MSSLLVTKLKVFATWDALFKNEMFLLQGSLIYLQQVMEDGIYIQGSTSWKGGSVIAYIHYLINYMLISYLQLATVVQLCSPQVHSVYSWFTKYWAIV